MRGLTLADPSPWGAVFAFRCDGSGRAVQTALANLPELDPEPPAFCWIHLNISDRQAADWVRAQPAIPDFAREMLLDFSRIHHIAAEDGIVAGSLIDSRLELDHSTDDPAALGFVLAPRYLVTARRRPVRAVSVARAALAEGARARSPRDLLSLIFRSEIEALRATVRELVAAIEVIEDRLLGDRVLDERRPIAQVRRRAFAQARLVQVLGGLARGGSELDPEDAPEDVIELFDDTRDRLEAIAHDIQMVKDSARTVQDEAGSRLTHETNRQLYVLSLLTALFLPATLVTGIFGMNTIDIVEGTHTITAMLIAVLASALVYFTLTRIMRPK